MKVRALATRGQYVLEVPENMEVGDYITLTDDEYNRAANLQAGVILTIKVRKNAKITARLVTIPHIYADYLLVKSGLV